MNIKLIKGDCLEKMKDISNGRVDMILCDPPYGTVKNMSIDGWKNKNEKCRWDETLDNNKLFEQYQRILRENGMLILFSQEPFTSQLRTLNYPNIEFAYPCIWEKDHFANALNSKKSTVNYFEDINIFYKKYDIDNLNPLRSYFKQILDFLNFKSCKDINKVLGHRKSEHSFYINSTQFKLCTESVYSELIKKFNINNQSWFKTYEELQKINNKFNRIFNLPKGKKIKSNIFKYKKDYEGLHPTQKPVALLENLINTYSNENMLILDNCMGSGSTGIACISTNRDFIGIEKDDKYFDIVVNRIKQYIIDNNIENVNLEIIE